MRLTLEQRKNLLAELPWVKRLKEPVETCDGVKWSTVALRDLYSMGNQPARGIQDRSRCTRRGTFRFKALKRSWARDGVYCYLHAWKEIHDHPEESERADRWMRKNHPELFTNG